MRYRLLGPLDVDRDGTSVDLGGRKQRAVLAVLLLDAGRVVATDRLAEALWGDEPPPTAVGTLQAYVSNLRRILGSPIERRPPGYVLTVAAGEVDLVDFVAGADAARTAVRTGNWLDALDAARRAAGLWRGPLLSEFQDEHWVRTEAAALGERRLECGENLVTALLALDRIPEAVVEAGVLTGLAPYGERPCHLRMTALHRAGRPAEALAVYREYADRLAGELGLDPGPSVRDLQAAILRQDRPAVVEETIVGRAAVLKEPAVVKEPAAVKGTVVGRPVAARGTVVGRERELAVIAEASERARGGESQWLVLTGPAGIGKSRLAQEAATRWRASGGRAVSVSCPEDDGLPPWWPVRVLLRALGADADAVLTRPDGLAADEARFAVADRAEAVFAGAASSAPLLVVVDDVQWADAASLRFLARLATTAAMLVLTLRDEPVSPDVRRLLTGPAHRLAIPALTGAEVAELAVAVGGGTLSGHEARELAEKTGGNPFFVIEYARLPAAARAEGQVPAGVRAVLERRLATLTPPALELLRAAAVAGDPFGADLLRSVLDERPDPPADGHRADALADDRRADPRADGRWADSRADPRADGRWADSRADPRADGRWADSRADPRVDDRWADPLADLLDEAIGAGMIEVAPAAGGYAFTHWLLREEVLRGIPAVRRLRLHARVAEALPDDPDRRATHLVAALPYLDPAPVYEACRRAALDAAGRWSSDAAAHWWGVALQVFPHLPASSRAAGERDDLVDAYVTALARAGRDQMVLDVVDAELLVAGRERRTASMGRLAGALLRTAGGWPWVSYAAEPRRLLTRLASTEALVGNDPAAHARVLAALAVGACYDPDPGRADELSRRAIERAGACADPEVLADALLARALVFCGVTTRVDEVRELLERVRSTPHAQQDVDEVLAHNMLCWAELTAGDVEAAERHLRLGVGGCDLWQLPVARVQLRWAEGTIAQWRGDFARARAVYRHAYDLHRKTELYGPGVYHIAMLTLRWNEGVTHPETPGYGEVDHADVPWAPIAAADRVEADRLIGVYLSGGQPVSWLTYGALTMIGHLVADHGLSHHAGELIERLRPVAHRVATVGHVGVAGPVARVLDRLERLLDSSNAGTRTGAETAVP